jgi:Mrp family chromosome partitioning ATPase
MVLSTRTDGVILVVKRGSTPYEALARVTEKMRSFGANLVGVVYNTTDSQIEAPSYSYAYGYERRAGKSLVENPDAEQTREDEWEKTKT